MYASRLSLTLSDTTTDLFADDIHLLPSHVDAFMEASHRLAHSPDSDTYVSTLPSGLPISPPPSYPPTHSHPHTHLPTHPHTPIIRWFPGFSRVEHDARREGAWATWETGVDDYTAVEVMGAGVLAWVTGSTHQAMWMATREQVGVCLFACWGAGLSVCMHWCAAALVLTGCLWACIGGGVGPYD